MKRCEEKVEWWMCGGVDDEVRGGGELVKDEAGKEEAKRAPCGGAVCLCFPRPCVRLCFQEVQEKERAERRSD